MFLIETIITVATTILAVMLILIAGFFAFFLVDATIETIRNRGRDLE